MIIGEEEEEKEEEKFGHFYAMMDALQMTITIAALIPLIRLDIE